MCDTIEVGDTGRDGSVGTGGHRRRAAAGLRRCHGPAALRRCAALFAAVVTLPGRAFAQINDTAPSNAGLPGGPLIAQVIGWGKWVGLAVCVMAMVYGAATWRGMGGNSGRGVEGKAYVGAGALGAMIIGLAVIAVNTLYSAGNAGG